MKYIGPVKFRTFGDQIHCEELFGMARQQLGLLEMNMQNASVLLGHTVAVDGKTVRLDDGSVVHVRFDHGTAFADIRRPLPEPVQPEPEEAEEKARSLYLVHEKIETQYRFKFRVVRDDGLLLTPENSPGLIFRAWASSTRQFSAWPWENGWDQEWGLNLTEEEIAANFEPYDYNDESGGFWLVEFPEAELDGNGQPFLGTGFTKKEFSNGFIVEVRGAQEPGIISVFWPNIVSSEIVFAHEATEDDEGREYRITPGEYEIWVPYFQSSTGSNINTVDTGGFVGQDDNSLRPWLELWQSGSLPEAGDILALNGFAWEASVSNPYVTANINPKFFRNHAKWTRTVSVKSSFPYNISSGPSPGSPYWQRALISLALVDIWGGCEFDPRPGYLQTINKIYGGSLCQPASNEDLQEWLNSFDPSFDITTHAGGSYRIDRREHGDSIVEAMVSTVEPATFQKAEKPLLVPIEPAWGPTFSVSAQEDSNLNWEGPECCQPEVAGNPTEYRESYYFATRLDTPLHLSVGIRQEEIEGRRPYEAQESVRLSEDEVYPSESVDIYKGGPNKDGSETVHRIDVYKLR